MASLWQWVHSKDSSTSKTTPVLLVVGYICREIISVAGRGVESTESDLALLATRYCLRLWMLAKIL